MLSYFVPVLKQVIILFIIMIVGMVMGKKNIIDKSGISQMSQILLKPVTFCMVVNAFLSVELSKDKLLDMIYMAVALIVVTGIGIVVAYAVFSRKAPEKNGILQFATIFSNCGFIGLPMTQAIFGDEGVVLVSFYVAIFQIVTFTYGVYLFAKKSSSYKFDIKKILLNAGVLGVLVGGVLMVTKISVPTMLTSPIEMIGSMNSPLAMIISGYYLCQIKFKFRKTDLNIFTACILRLVVIPVFSIIVLYLIGIRGFVLAVSSIPICAPVATFSVILAEIYDNDTVLTVRTMSISILLSIITMPIVVSYAIWLSGI